MNQRNFTPFASLLLRCALATAFLSAVADRFGWWGPPGTGNVGWGEFDAFLKYTAQLNWFLPQQLIPLLGWTATVLEVLFAVALLSGIATRWTALGSGVLLLLFATTMTVAYGAEAPLSYSVWTAAASAFLLASLPSHLTGYGFDAWRNKEQANSA